MIVGVITLCVAITGREYEHSTQAITTIFHAFAQSLIGKRESRAVEVIRERINTAPAVVAHIVLPLLAQGLSDLTPTPFNPGRNKFDVRRDAAYTCFIVLNRTDDARNLRTVIIRRQPQQGTILGIAVLSIKLSIVRQGKVHVGLQIRMRHIDTVIHNTYRDTRARIDPVQLGNTSLIDVPLRARQGIRLAAIELSYPQSISTRGRATARYIEVVLSACCRRELYSSI